MRVLLWVALLGSLWQATHCQPAVGSSSTPPTSFFDASKAPAPGSRADGEYVFKCSLDTNPSGLRRQTVGQPLVLMAVPTVTWTGPQGVPITQPVIGAEITFDQTGCGMLPATRADTGSPPVAAEPCWAVNLGRVTTSAESQGRASLPFIGRTLGPANVSADILILGQVVQCIETGTPVGAPPGREMRTFWVPPNLTLTVDKQVLTVGEDLHVHVFMHDEANKAVMQQVEFSPVGVGRVSATPVIIPHPSSVHRSAGQGHKARISGGMVPVHRMPGDAYITYTSYEPGTTTMSYSALIGNTRYSSDSVTVTWLAKE